MSSLKTICFYLPQYHPIAENDAWWGAGFTEWDNVRRGRPNFAGHDQPRRPSELGYYDLRDVGVQARQSALAREHGIHGFCYHHYWFNGRRLLERPLAQLLAHPEIDFPFCVCWANENWTRTWDGRAHDVLMAQHHTPEDDEAFLRALLPALRDPRYIRVEDRPLLVVYRVDLFPDAPATAARWRRIAREAGFADLHLCAVQFEGVGDPRPWGFDAAIEFPPHDYLGSENQPEVMPVFTNERFRGNVVDYQKLVGQALARPIPEYLLYRGVIPSWDNTARRQDAPHIVINGSPLDYHAWLRHVAEQTRRIRRAEHQLVFINAWNEWGEGCYLEPDERHGRRYLEATRAALANLSPIDDALAGLAELAGGANGTVAEIRQAFEARERALYAVQDVVRHQRAELDRLRGVEWSSHPAIGRAKTALHRYPRVKRALKRLLDKP